jgi:hypothetical protein
LVPGTAGGVAGAVVPRLVVVGTSEVAVVAGDVDAPVAVAQQVNAAPWPPVHPAHIASHNTPVAPVDLVAPVVAEVAVVLRFPLFLL